MTKVRAALTKEEREHLALLLYLDNSVIGLQIETKLIDVRPSVKHLVAIAKEHKIHLSPVPMVMNSELRFIHLEKK